MQVANVDDRLAGVTVLGQLAASERRALAARCRWRRYAAHEQIILCGSDTHEVFFVVSGCVRVVNYSAAGREISFEDIGAGGCIGEVAAIDGEGRSASVFALVDPLLASLPSRSFLDLMAAHPEIGIEVMRRLARMVRQANEPIMSISTLSAHNRVHAELLRLAQAVDCETTVAQNEGTAVIRPAPVHADIANRVSTTRETVARVLSDLAKTGVVQRKKGTLVISDWRRLVDLVEHPKEI